MISAMVKTYQSIDTVYSADSVEWCPAQDFQDVVLCGTYQLEEGTQQNSGKQSQVRVGRLYTFILQKSEKDLWLKEAGHLDMPGILDIKWSYRGIQDQTVFAMVNSVGQLKVFSLQPDGKSMCLVSEVELGTDLLGLSLDWNNMTSTRSPTRITSSDSAGYIHVHQLDDASLKTVAKWKGHDFEAWITAFDQWNNDILYTGGDDCRLKAWDLRVEPSTPILNSKRHSMGVCSIQSNPVTENILATGSYDEYIILWDTRNMKQALSECRLGGGIWRIKWEPKTASHILTATMYNGFHVIDTTSLQEPKILLHYTAHDSIGYGADWFRNISSSELGAVQHDTSQHVIATCSFYDHLLNLWTYSDVIPGHQ